MFLSYWLYCIPYSREFSLVQILTEMCPNPSEEIFAVFIFAEWKHDALTTPLPDDGHAPYARVTEEMTLNDGLNWLVEQKVQHCWSRLDNFWVSLTGSLILYTRVNKRIRLWKYALNTQYVLNKWAKLTTLQNRDTFLVARVHDRRVES